MKRFIQLAILISMVASPFTGYCGYQREAEESGVDGWIRRGPHAKCLLLVDMVKNTKDKKKKAVLKINLEVEVVAILDRILYNIEDCEMEIECHIGRLEEAETQKEVDELNISIALGQREIEKYRQAYSKIEPLLKYTR